MAYAPIKNKTNKSYNDYLPNHPISDALNSAPSSTQSRTRTPTPIPTSNSTSLFITPQNLSRNRPLFAPLKEKRIERSNEIPYLHSLERQNNLSSQSSSNDITMIDISMSNDITMTDDNYMDDVQMTPKRPIKYSVTTPQGVQHTNRSSLYHHDNIISPPIPRSLIYDFDTIKIIEQPYPF